MDIEFRKQFIQKVLDNISEELKYTPLKLDVYKGTLEKSLERMCTHSENIEYDDKYDTFPRTFEKGNVFDQDLRECFLSDLEGCFLCDDLWEEDLWNNCIQDLKACYVINMLLKEFTEQLKEIARAGVREAFNKILKPDPLKNKNK